MAVSRDRKSEIQVVHTTNGTGICPECGNGLWRGQSPCEYRRADAARALASGDAERAKRLLGEDYR